MMSDALQITNVLIVVVPFFSCLEIKGNGLGNKCAFKYTNRKTTALLGSYCTCVYYFFFYFLQQTLPVLFICNWQEGILFIYRTVFVQLGNAFWSSSTCCRLPSCGIFNRNTSPPPLQTLGLADLGLQGVAGLLCVAQQHGRVGLVEDGVVHSCVSDAQGTFHHNHLARRSHDFKKWRVTSCQCVTCVYSLPCPFRRWWKIQSQF